jgi:hypothetical protein
MSSAPIRLSPHERDSAAWQKVEWHANARLALHRAKVENPLNPEAERLGAAWRIQELKELLKLASQPAEPQQDASE